LADEAFLLGCYLIVSWNQYPARVYDLLNESIPPLAHMREQGLACGLRLSDGWQGLHRAKCLGWIDQADLKCKPATDQEHAYFQIVPDNLLVIVARTTNSKIQIDPSTTLPAMLDILASHRVGTLVRLGDNSDRHADEAFSLHGITSVACSLDADAPPPAADRALLPALLAAGSPRGLAVAIDCGREKSASDSLSRVAALCSQHLVEAHGFDAGAARAWLQLASPPLGLSGAIVCAEAKPSAADACNGEEAHLTVSSAAQSSGNRIAAPAAALPIASSWLAKQRCPPRLRLSAAITEDEAVAGEPEKDAPALQQAPQRRQRDDDTAAPGATYSSSSRRAAASAASGPPSPPSARRPSPDELVAATSDWLRSCCAALRDRRPLASVGRWGGGPIPA
jgi:hypothetical protein